MFSSSDTPSQPEPNTLVLEDESLQYGFIQIPKQILHARNLSRDAKFLYAILLSYAWQEHRCFPGYSRLCHDMQASENMVRKYMRELEAVGLLRQKRRGLGKTNLYTLPDLRTSKIEVLEPQFSDVPEPAKTEGKLETLEKETDISKFRKAHAKKSRDETGETDTPSDPLIPDQAVSQSINRPEWGSDALQRDLAAASVPNGSEGLLVPVAPETPATAGSVRPRHQSANRSRQESRFQALTDLLPAPPARAKPPGGREEREIVTAYFQDFRPFLGDEAPLWHSVSRAINIFKKADMPRERWPDLLNEANSIVKAKTQHIRKKPGKSSNGFAVKNRTPYYFAVLEDLCGLREESDSSIPGTP